MRMRFLKLFMFAIDPKILTARAFNLVLAITNHDTFCSSSCTRACTLMLAIAHAFEFEKLVQLQIAKLQSPGHWYACLELNIVGFRPAASSDGVKAVAMATISMTGWFTGDRGRFRTAVAADKSNSASWSMV